MPEKAFQPKKSSRTSAYELYKIIFSKDSIKSLERIPKEYQIKVKNVVKRLSEDPFKLDLKKLSQAFKATHRLRLGPYRIFLAIDIEAKKIYILGIVHRTTRTYR